jgi:hypothetical protein
MDIGTIFIGIVLLVVAWACWTYLPAPINVIAGIIFALVGLYFILIGLVGDLDHANVEGVTETAARYWGVVTSARYWG